jgi:hypothetical protein
MMVLILYASVSHVNRHIVPNGARLTMTTPDYRQYWRSKWLAGRVSAKSRCTQAPHILIYHRPWTKAVANVRVYSFLISVVGNLLPS